MKKTVWALAVTAMLCAAPAMASSIVARIDLSEQQMRVYVNGAQRYVWPVSTARRGYVTPVGTYRPQRLEPMWYSRKYDMSPMPHSIFFRGGYAIHGTNAVRRLGDAGFARLRAAASQQRGDSLFARQPVARQHHDRRDALRSREDAMSVNRQSRRAHTVAGAAPDGAREWRRQLLGSWRPALAEELKIATAPMMEVTEVDVADADVATPAMPPEEPSVPTVVARIDLSDQTMTVYVEEKLSYVFKVSTGRRGYGTPTGQWNGPVAVAQAPLEEVSQRPDALVGVLPRRLRRPRNHRGAPTGPAGIAWLRAPAPGQRQDLLPSWFRKTARKTRWLASFVKVRTRRVAGACDAGHRQAPAHGLARCGVSDQDRGFPSSRSIERLNPPPSKASWVLIIHAAVRSPPGGGLLLGPASRT